MEGVQVLARHHAQRVVAWHGAAGEQQEQREKAGEAGHAVITPWLFAIQFFRTVSIKIDLLTP